MSALNCRTEVIELDSPVKWAWHVGKGLLEENSGAMKGLGVAAFGMAAKTVTQEGGAGDTGDGLMGIIRFLVDNPLDVMLWSAGGAGAYGLLYSLYNNTALALKERSEMRSEAGQAREQLRLAEVAKLGEKLTQQATKDDGTIDETELAKSKLQSGYFILSRESKPKLTKSMIFNGILQTLVDEATEGLDVGIKLTLLPAFIVAKTTQLVSYAITADNQGVPLPDVMKTLTPDLLQLIPVTALGGWALIKDAITVVRQRSAFVLIPQQQ